MKITFIGKLLDYFKSKKQTLIKETPIENNPYIKPTDPDETNTLEKMKEIYQPGKKDWMGYTASKKNRLKVYYIPSDYDNSQEIAVLLTKKAYNKLLTLENYYPELYSEYLYMLQMISDFACPPVNEIRHIMDLMQERLEASLKCQSQECVRYMK